MNVTILGTGAYGLALSKRFLMNNCNVTLWTAIMDEYNMIKNERINKQVLPTYYIDDRIKIESDLKEALLNVNLIVVAIPIKYISNVIKQVSEFYNGASICIASKGISQDDFLFPYDIVKKSIDTDKIGIISGGTFAIDMINDIPLGLVAASKDDETLNLIDKCLKNDLLKIEKSNDIIGAEIFATMKNIVAIGCGIIDGMNYPESSKCLFFTKCFNDISNFVLYFGGDKNTAYTYAGIGDLFLTCTSLKSRNYTLGNMIGKKIDANEINKYLENTTVEGYYALLSFYELIHKKNINSKLIDTLYMIIYNKEPLSLLDEYLIS